AEATMRAGKGLQARGTGGPGRMPSIAGGIRPKPPVAHGGFTLVEMMIVITISLALMTMVVPIFNLVTRTTIRIERKLAVYEAARMMLDFYENEIENEIYDSRGNHFGIKHG